MSLILADTSVWIGHLRQPDPLMSSGHIEERLLTHPAVIGELAMGNLPKRGMFLSGLALMNQPNLAADEEVVAFVERHGLYGLGLGWTDAHLLVSALLTPDCDLWTRDARLDAAASRFGRAARFHH